MLSILGAPSKPTCLPPQPIINPGQQSTQLLPHDLADLPSTTKPIKHRCHSSSFPRSARNSADSMSRRSPQKPSPRTAVRPAEVVRRDDDWTTRPELRLRVLGLPTDINTHALWNSFSSHGAVSQIEIFENNRGLRDGSARVTFR